MIRISSTLQIHGRMNNGSYSLSPVVNCVDIEDRDSGCICIPLVMIILMYSGWRAETHPSVNKKKTGYNHSSTRGNVR